MDSEPTSPNTDPNPLTETLDLVENEAASLLKISIGDILIALNHKGFGPLMMFPALVVLLPTGAVPGVPAFCGISLCLFSSQVIMGRHYPWIPDRIKNLSIKRKKLMAIVERTRPVASFVDRFISARLPFLSTHTVNFIIAIICIVLGVFMIVVGFIPFLPSILALPVLLFALGTTAKDGVMILAGFAFTVAAFIFVLWMSGLMGGEDRLRIN